MSACIWRIHSAQQETDRGVWQKAAWTTTEETNLFYYLFWIKDVWPKRTKTTPAKQWCFAWNAWCQTMSSPHEPIEIHELPVVSFCTNCENWAANLSVLCIQKNGDGDLGQHSWIQQSWENTRWIASLESCCYFFNVSILHFQLIFALFIILSVWTAVTVYVYSKQVSLENETLYLNKTACIHKG